ncbi:MAG: nuclear transport factor 2 family protein [Rhizobiaceae bacterium]
MSDDERAIMAVIEAEAAAYWNKDFDAFACCWVQARHVRRMGWWERSGIRMQRGWDEIAARMRQVMAESPVPNPNAAIVRRDNLSITVIGDMAWLTFDQTGIETGDRDMDMPGVSHETRVMERHGGDWKIAYVGFLLRG